MTGYRGGGAELNGTSERRRPCLGNVLGLKLPANGYAGALGDTCKTKGLELSKLLLVFLFIVALMLLSDFTD